SGDRNPGQYRHRGERPQRNRESPLRVSTRTQDPGLRQKARRRPFAGLAPPVAGPSLQRGKKPETTGATPTAAERPKSLGWTAVGDLQGGARAPSAIRDRREERPLPAS